MIFEADWCVEEFLKELDRLNLTDNTLVILTNDNGPVLDDGYQDQAEGGDEESFPVSLHDTRPSVPSDESAVLSEKSLYLLFLYGEAAGRGGRVQMGEAFFSRDSEGLYGIPGEAEDL